MSHAITEIALLLNLVARLPVNAYLHAGQLAGRFSAADSRKLAGPGW